MSQHKHCATIKGTSALKFSDTASHNTHIVDFEAYKSQVSISNQKHSTLKEKTLHAIKNDPLFSDFWAEPRPQTRIAHDTKPLIVGLLISCAITLIAFLAAF